ncbi:TIGR00730 family Rossman fold protein [Microbacterium betulae]|uniref:Cytokinin riboside 5'-monophosphate phosphoribohydrolase n=1 Tax=Microbacterium betulae TaxID=2981139 RepID=A0AA97I472_9MICO|nr:TIGR00730 family Rossman fold protein [Microbacterium sp. AB]WOF21479.1 TIGR00730 family Rossman fold protein [Microbacterium sp. AB]
MRVTVFLGSAHGTGPGYTAATIAFGEALARRGFGLVYGGGRVGLMGTLADAASAAGGEVTGVIPQGLVDAEISHDGLTTLEVVPDMHARKLRMAELGDAFVALPGGAGTLEELFEAWTWLQLGIHGKPVALLDVDGFWQPLVRALDHMTAEGFVRERFRTTLIVEEDVEDLLDVLLAWRSPAPKWGNTTPRP